MVVVGDHLEQSEDPRDPRDQRDRNSYPRNDHYNHPPSSREWAGPSRTRSPEIRRGDEGDPYYRERHEHDRMMAMRERDDYGDRRSDSYYREREGYRGPPYPSRNIERDSYDRRTAKGDWAPAPPPGRPRSPYNSWQASPPYSSRRPSSPQDERRVQIPTRGPPEEYSNNRRDSGMMPTGPREVPTGPSRMNGAPPPSGPRTSFSRPPPGPNTSNYGGRSEGPPPTGPRGLSYEGSSRNFDRRVEEDKVSQPVPAAPPAAPLSVDKLSVPGETAIKKDNFMPSEPTQANPREYEMSIAVSTANNNAAPRLSVKERLGNLDRKYFGSFPHSEMEAEAFNLSTARLRSVNSIYSRREFVALRKALNTLADSEVELAGARTRTNLAEVSLQQAKEEAESCNLESARIEMNEKNGGTLGWLTTSL